MRRETDRGVCSTINTDEALQKYDSLVNGITDQVALAKAIQEETNNSLMGLFTYVECEIVK